MEQATYFWFDTTRLSCVFRSHLVLAHVVSHPVPHARAYRRMPWMMIDPPYRAIDPSLQVLPAPGLHSLVYEKDFPDIDAFSEEVCKELNARPLHQPPLLWTLMRLKNEKNDSIKLNTRVGALEFGVGEGRSLAAIAESLRENLGEENVRLAGFDSFHGLPEDWIPEWKKGSFSQDGVAVEVDGADIVPGMFDTTVPNFFTNKKTGYPSWKSQGIPIRLVHVDCDLYASAKTVLDNLGAALKSTEEFMRGTAGCCYVVFDELVGYDDYKKHEMRALYEFARDNKDVFLLDVVGSDGREVSGDPMRYFTPEEACAHRAVLRLRPRLSYHEDEYFEIDAHDGPIE